MPEAFYRPGGGSPSVQYIPVPYRLGQAHEPVAGRLDNTLKYYAISAYCHAALLPG